MTDSIKILKMHPKSFKANVYTTIPFRMIGLIDVNIKYNENIELVTLPFFRSSGTNSGKIKGLWYPIVGIKTVDGNFIEFTRFLNFVMTNCTKNGEANHGWLAKSLFFSPIKADTVQFRGFSNGSHYNSLLTIGENLRALYENNNYTLTPYLDAKTLNNIVTSKTIYKDNIYSQRYNFERFIHDIFINV